MINAYLKSDLSKLDILERQLPGIAENGARAVGEFVVNDINATWSDSSPSPRGGPPAKVTGRLERSVVIQGRDVSGRFSSGKEVVGVSIRYTAPYSGRLEFGDLERPYLGPALDRAQSHMPLIFAAAFSTGIGQWI